ncbi:type II toxin-antitoxin system VapC family toxin [soil metagenome]
MIYLLDTQIVLWAALDAERLGRTARLLLDDPTNGFMFSSAVIWEATIKSAQGRKDFSVDPRLLHRGLLTNGATELPVTSRHGLAVADLPPLHKDPFDRIQVAQARVEGLVLLTADAQVAAYGSPVELV